MENEFVPKTITIRKDQEEWLKDKGRHISLSKLTQKAIDEEVVKQRNIIVD